MALCFDKDIFAYNSVTKVKLKKVISESFNFFFALSAGFLILSIACS